MYYRAKEKRFWICIPADGRGTKKLLEFCGSIFSGHYIGNQAGEAAIILFLDLNSNRYELAGGKVETLTGDPAELGKEKGVKP